MKLIVAFVAVLLVSGCSAPRYARYEPSKGPALEVKAEKSFAGRIKIHINGDLAMNVIFPAFGEREDKGTYKGHRLSAILRTKTLPGGMTEWECMFHVDGKLLETFRWH